jgi:hypothetical protein
MAGVITNLILLKNHLFDERLFPLDSARVTGKTASPNKAKTSQSFFACKVNVPVNVPNAGKMSCMGDL